jgi:LmbE family N-acetylglucosaminyl deacetylase
MVERKVLLSLLAHPDDAEFLCAGTLALLRRKGWEIHIATMTPGDCGSVEHGREEISTIRRGEGVESAKLLDGTYHCCECEDLFITYDKPTLLRAIEVLRKVRPTVVFALSPQDYSLDHEMASKVAQAATFAGGIPNVAIDGVEPFEPVPYLYYLDAVDGVDRLGNSIEPGIVVDIGSEMETKEKMLCCHASQRGWLMAHHGVDEYVNSMKAFSQSRGELIGADFAEGFRQHLGHCYPSDNILKSELGELVFEMQGKQR